MGGPGGGFRTGRSSGKATAGTGAKKTTPRTTKTTAGKRTKKYLVALGAFLVVLGVVWVLGVVF